MVHHYTTMAHHTTILLLFTMVFLYHNSIFNTNTSEQTHIYDLSFQSYREA